MPSSVHPNMLLSDLRSLGQLAYHSVALELQAMRFSERMGIKPVKSTIQIDSMDEDLRNSLWNVFYWHVFRRIGADYVSQTRYKGFSNLLWLGFFKLPLDDMPNATHRLHYKIREWFYECNWNDIYDFIEEISKIGQPVDSSEFRRHCNTVLKRELSGYRFVGEQLARITKEQELAAIEEAMEKSSSGKLRGINEHLKAALAKLSDRKEPDYRNSIKESISAIESLAKLISGDEKATLGKALRVLKGRIGLHEALEKGYKAIYGWTSDEEGIRHGMMEIPDCDLEDAQYMLVSCSAFISYLIVKAQKAEIELS